MLNQNPYFEIGSNDCRPEKNSGTGFQAAGTGATVFMRKDACKLWAGGLLADKCAGKNIQDHLINSNGGIIAMSQRIDDTATDNGRYHKKYKGSQSPANCHLSPHEGKFALRLTTACLPAAVARNRACATLLKLANIISNRSGCKEKNGLFQATVQ